MATGTPTGGLGEKARAQLTGDVKDLAGALGEYVVGLVSQRMGRATGRLTGYAQQGGGPGLVAAVTGAQKLAEGKSPARAMLSAGLAGGKEKLMGVLRRGGGKGQDKKKIKVTNIVETIEVGVPVRTAYDQWTRYQDFPSFMKKVENVERGDSDEKSTWKAQVFWSHRSWESTVIRQVPDQLIHWRSKGEKGHVDGTVSFHELTPNLTRILVVLEYHPQGLFEHTGNLWRAQGRRARLELKHFVRHVMTVTALDPDQVEGWRGEIRDGEVVKDHETALREEQEEREAQQAREEQEQRRGDDRGEERDEPELAGDVDDEEYDEGDEYDDESYPEPDQYDEYDEEDEEEPEPEPEPRRPVTRSGRPVPGSRDRRTGAERPPVARRGEPEEAPRSRRTRPEPDEEARPRRPRTEREETEPSRPVRRTTGGARRPVARRRGEQDR